MTQNEVDLRQQIEKLETPCGCGCRYKGSLIPAQLSKPAWKRLTDSIKRQLPSIKVVVAESSLIVFEYHEFQASVTESMTQNWSDEDLTNGIVNYLLWKVEESEK